MSSKQEILLKVSADAREANENLKQSQAAVKELKDRMAELKAENKENTDEYKNLKAELKEQKEAVSDYKKELDNLEDAHKKSINTNKELEKTLNDNLNSQRSYQNQNEDLIRIREKLQATDDNYLDNLERIRAQIEQNNEKIAEANELQTNGTLTMGYYKDKVTEAFDAINVFNGGISGFVSRAEAAGGAGNLLSDSFSLMKTGITGVGKAITANPLGILLSVLGPLIQKLMSFPPVTQAVEKAFAALGPVIELVNKPLQLLAEGIALVIEGFADFVGSSTEAGRAAQQLAKDKEALKNSEEKLSAAMSVQEERNLKVKQSIDELMKVAKDQTKTEQDRLKALDDAHKLEKANLQERKKLSQDAYNNAVTSAALGKGLSKKELEELQKQGAAYAEKMMTVKKFTQEEIDALKKANIDRLNISSEEKKILASYKADQAKIAQEAAAKRKADEEQQKQAAEARKQRAAKAARDAIDVQKLELDMYVESKNAKAHTMKEELEIAEEVHRRKLKIINAEFAASDKSAKAKAERDKAKQQEDIKLLKQKAETTASYAEKELKAYISANEKSLISVDKINDELIKKEGERIAALEAKELAYLKQRSDSGLINTEEYEKAKKAITDKYDTERENIQKTKDANAKADDDDKKKKLAEQNAIELEIKRANAQSEFELQRMDEDARHKQAMDDLDTRLNQKKLTEEQYNALKKAEEEKNADNLKKIDQAVFDNKMSLTSQSLSAVAELLGKNTAAGKAAAIAQTTIDTYLAAQKAYTSQLIPGDPTSPIRGAIVAAAAVASGLANVKKITSTKTPKAEKGALFSIGGKRHSQGGTLFTGEDGTRFEAEAGEVIGVMNRNAARHFMAFNNTFPAGGGGSTGGNYFAQGGIVSREVAQQGINLDELAAKIAQANAAIPAPVVTVQHIVTQSSSYVKVRQAANF